MYYEQKRLPFATATKPVGAGASAPLAPGVVAKWQCGKGCCAGLPRGIQLGRSPKFFLKNGLVRYKWKYGKSAGDLPLGLSNFHVDETSFRKLDVLSTQSTVSFCKNPSDLRNDLRNTLRRNLRCHSDTDRNDKSFGGVGARLGGVSVGGAAVSFEFRVLGFELRKKRKSI